ncbi:MAG: VanZ family protein [Nitrospirae bacterium]|nr:MAG: VanZ family protein [Nitrospirota bacterium]
MFAKTLFYITAALIFVLSVVPNYKHLPDVFSLSDVLNHFAAFAVLAALLDSAYRKMGIPQKILILLGYGLFIEVVQYFIPYRKFSLADLAIDGVGVCAYFVVAWKILIRNSSKA